MEVFSWIEEKYNIKIAYSKTVVTDRPVSQEFDKASIEQVMQTLLANTGLQYRFADQQRIIIGPKGSDSEPDGQAAQEPEIISGQILDQQTGWPLAFANILVAGSGYGATSDEQGHFQISVPEQPADKSHPSGIIRGIRTARYSAAASEVNR